jgi:hypothetical protein
MLMDSLIKTLSEVLRMVGNQPEVAEAAAIAAWKKAAGEGLRQHAVPLRFEKGKLVVAVADAVWQKQLGAMNDELIYRTNKILSQPLVKEVELIIEPGMLSKVEERVDDEPVLDNQVPLELWSAANAISDKELRQKFLRTATRALQRREHEE